MPVEFKHTAPCPFSMPVGFAISMAERNKKKNDRVRGRPVVLSPFGCEVKQEQLSLSLQLSLRLRARVSMYRDR